VLEALREGGVRRVLVARGVERKFIKRLEEAGARYELVPRIELDQLVRTTHHQGVVAEIRDIRLADPQEPLKRAQRRGEKPLLVLLDGVTDPRNYGAIIRSAEALGAHGVVSEARRSAPLSAVAVKASAGAAYHLPVAQVPNLPRYITELKQAGVWVYGLAGEGETALEEADYDRPLAWVVGSEGSGLRRLVRDRCDQLVHIPLAGKTASLNAAVAAGIAIHWAVAARRG